MGRYRARLYLGWSDNLKKFFTTNIIHAVSNWTQGVFFYILEV
ncbi:MAG: hypothetical protein US30_C0016G0019 [Candidatus Moranbacteria bacterium GW2011_GWF2_36_839]|nr:MAG: hypothetical protein US27_C0017G0019 [Candidatus Moranbacteria bacterium GW2011_GWF1_36_78]KKQ16495.1 MAG: hypothetical protein US30_C0016G0019 [Candidatus Moranbacteria bacterium GW2011_GWF2_36_839]